LKEADQVPIVTMVV